MSAFPPNTTIPAGTIINGPDGQGYKILREIRSGVLEASNVEAIGGAPAVIPGTLIPKFLLEGLQRISSMQEGEE